MRVKPEKPPQRAHIDASRPVSVVQQILHLDERSHFSAFGLIVARIKCMFAIWLYKSGSCNKLSTGSPIS